MKEINLETILLETFQSRKEMFYRNFSITESFLIQEDMKKACRQTLELAAENAKTYTETYCSPYREEWDKIVDRKSILNTIDQVK